jgi:hypothetical protein
LFINFPSTFLANTDARPAGERDEMKIFKQLDTWYVSFFTNVDPPLCGTRKYARARAPSGPRLTPKRVCARDRRNWMDGERGNAKPALP